MSERIKLMIGRSREMYRAVEFPFDHLKNRIEYFPEDWPKIEVFADNTRPILSRKISGKLIPDFLEFKSAHGTDLEKRIFDRMSADSLIERLMKKRPVVFMESCDNHLLMSRKQGLRGFDNLPEKAETEEINMNDYISYDEMAISALISVSTPTLFINSGSRDNEGYPGPDGTYQTEGVYVASVGARFEREGFMEWRHHLVTEKQNVESNGFGWQPENLSLLPLWAELYGVPYFPTFEEVEHMRISEPERFAETYEDVSVGSRKVYLNRVTLKERYRLVIEPFLLEANDRAEANGCKAYVHAVGLGLGVWMVSPCQTQILLDAYLEILEAVALPHISDIDFSWFSASRLGPVHSGGKFVSESNGNDITIIFSRRNPADPVPQGKLLVAQYAWDSNSFPGNEYWFGSLSASGDPAAACCSLISELQNPVVNIEAFAPGNYRSY